MLQQFTLPPIPSDQRTPLVEALLGIIVQQAEQITKQAEQIQLGKEQIQALRDEIAVLKGQKPKPKIPKSKLEGSDKDGKDGKQGNGGKRPGSAKRSKTGELEIHDTVPLGVEGVGADWKFKGYTEFVVQGLVIEPHNTKYVREQWVTPEGKVVTAPLPDDVSSHFDPILVSYIQHQYFACRVTQPLLLEQLLEIGIDISSGQLNRILTEDNDDFHEEKEGILHAGLTVSAYAQADDTGQRHEGKNGFCTCISNDLFAYFFSSGSKSRINFLEILRAGHSDYLINEDALAYMRLQKLKQGIVAAFEKSSDKLFASKENWQKHLEKLEIAGERHIKIATEAALLASAISHGLPRDLIILSDDAGQFNILLLLHALCWVHAERLINKLVGFNDAQRNALQTVRDQIWDLYQELKLYKDNPTESLGTKIETTFDTIFTQKTCFESLNQVLTRLNGNKAELLRVLNHPSIPLHNNGCETDVREAVTKRKVSGGTQSELGRLARDTFLSLKRTCRKLGISFWRYLSDRNSAARNIPPLFQLIIEKAATAK